MEDNTASKLEEYLKSVQSLDLGSLKCPVTGHKAVAICTNPEVERKLVCTSCLVRDVEYVKKNRADLIPLDDIKPKLTEAINGYTKSDIDSINIDLLRVKSSIQKDLLNCVAQGFEDNFMKRKEEILQLIKSQDTQQKTEEEKKAITNWVTKPKDEFLGAMKSPNAVNAVAELLCTLKNDKMVKAQLAISEVTMNSCKYVESKKEHLKKEAENMAEGVINYFLSEIDLAAGFDKACVLRRWAHLNQAYNYMNGLNSLLIMVNEPTYLFGFSQYFTTNPSFNVKFKLVQGENSSDPLVVSEFEFQLRSESTGQPDRTVEGISQRTFPVFLPRPVQLKANIWYNISFDKPIQSHHIYYGSSPLQAGGETFNFADGKKTIRFRRAPDDTIDNSHSLGQFPDFYLK